MGLDKLYSSLKVFRKDFMDNSFNKFENQNELGQFNSIKGRRYIFYKLLVSTGNIPLKIAKKILRVASAIFNLMSELIHVGPGYFKRLHNTTPVSYYLTQDQEKILRKQQPIVHLIDESLSLLGSPLFLVVGRVRLVLGLIHPGIVFRRESIEEEDYYSGNNNNHNESNYEKYSHSNPDIRVFPGESPNDVDSDSEK